MEEEYLGYKIITADDNEVSDFYQNMNDNPYGCLENEYLVLQSKDGTVIESYRWSDGKMVRVPFKTINTKFAGRVRPRNIQQQLAVDMLYNDNVTIKMMAGKYGTGKLLAPLYSNI